MCLSVLMNSLQSPYGRCLGKHQQRKNTTRLLLVNSMMITAQMTATGERVNKSTLDFILSSESALEAHAWYYVVFVPQSAQEQEMFQFQLSPPLRFRSRFGLCRSCFRSRFWLLQRCHEWGEVHGHIPFSSPKHKKEKLKEGGWEWGVVINLPNTDVGPKRGTGWDMFPVILTSAKSKNSIAMIPDILASTETNHCQCY